MCILFYIEFNFFLVTIPWKFYNNYTQKIHENKNFNVECIRFINFCNWSISNSKITFK